MFFFFLVLSVYVTYTTVSFSFSLVLRRLFWFFPQLDEGGIKPRPGSDVSNINAPSPLHKV